MKRTLTALTLAAATALSAPAHAGGVISFEVEARNANDAQAIGILLGTYQVMNDIKANGHITQNGMNNIAAMAQRGTGNVGVIHQEGDNHDASLQQTGNHNAYGIFQVGNGASGHVDQAGNGQAGLLFQIGF
ncbi:MAG: hypothetical protein QNJ44_03815 [Rhodobacter sp.]|nr:hypothetical protein [Rhodobacter sp.]